MGFRRCWVWLGHLSAWTIPVCCVATKRGGQLRLKGLIKLDNYSVVINSYQRFLIYEKVPFGKLSRNFALNWQPTAGQWAANIHSNQQRWGTACRTGPALQTVCYPPQVSRAAMECTRTVLFPGGIRRLVSFRIYTLKIEKLRRPLAIHCWAAHCQQAFNPAVVGHSL